MKKIVLFFALIPFISFSQVGVNTTDPKTALDVVGAITNREVSFTVSSNVVNIATETSLANITGAATATVSVTSYTPAVNGHRLIISNTTSGGFGATFAGITIPNNQSIEFIYTNGAWKSTLGGTGTGTNIYNANGTITNNRIVSQTDKTLAFTSTATTGTSHFTVDGSTFNVDAVNNRVGIGTSIPTTTLDVGGNFKIYGNALGDFSGAELRPHVNSGSFTVYSGVVGSGTPRFTVTNSGNVGIGTLTPSAQFHTTGSVMFTGAGTPALNKVLVSDATGLATWQKQTATNTDSNAITASSSQVAVPSTNVQGAIGDLATAIKTVSLNDWKLDGNSNGAIKKFGTIDAFDVPFITSNTERMRILANGNVGIGTASPTTKLDVAAGTTTANTVVNATGSINDFLQFNVQNTSTGTQAQSGYSATANNGSATTGFAWMGINNSTFNYPTAYNIGGANDVSFVGSGQDLHLANANNTKSIIFSTGKSTTPFFNERMRITNAGNVGIGTSTPFGRLNVSGGTVIGTGAFSGSTAGIPFSYGDLNNSAIWFGNYDNTATSDYGLIYLQQTSANVSTLNILAGDDAGGTSSDDSIFIGNVDTSATKKGVTIKNGFTGIGTTTPTAQLHTTGSVLFAGAGTPTLGRSLVTDATGLATWQNPLASNSTSTAITASATQVAVPSTNVQGAIGDLATAIKTVSLNDWKLDGNSNGAIKKFGTIDAFDVPFITSNTERMRILANGNVGIGTSTPNAPLQFPNTLANRKEVLWEDGNNDHQFYGFGINSAILRYQISSVGTSHAFYAGTSATTSNELMRIQGNGNVGIGTASPATKLDVAAGTTTVNTVVNAKGSINDFLQFNVQNTSTGTQAQSGYSATADNGSATTGFAWMGINNSTFNYPTAYNIGLANDVSFVGSGQDLYLANANNTKSIIFSTGKSTTPFFNERMRITNAGNVGIGTSNPNGKLHLFETIGSTLSSTTGSFILEHGDTGGQSSILFKSAINPTSDYGYIKYSDDGSGTGASTENSLLEIGVQNDIPGNASQDDIAIMSSGNVGVGTRTPLAQFHTTGSIMFSGAGTPALNKVLVSDATGLATWQKQTATNTDSNAITASSSQVAVPSTNVQGAISDLATAVKSASLNSWTLDGNSNGAIKKFGTIDAFDVPFITSNTERMRILSSGNVGVGATSPFAKFQVNTASTIDGLVVSSGATWDGIGFAHDAATGYINAGGAENGIAFRTNTSASGTFTTNPFTEQMRILANGNVGIGTASPTTKLDVAAGTTTVNTVVNATGNINDFLQFNVQNTSTGTQAQSGYSATANNGSATTGFAWMGINNSTFNYPTAYNIGGANDVSFVGSGQDLHLANANNTKSIIFSTGKSTTPFFNERMRITNAGNVGIGTTTPNAPLQFANSITNRKVVLWEAANNDHQFFGFGINNNVLRYQVNATADSHIFYAGTSASTSNELMRIQGDGNVGIGTSTPFHKLTISGSQAIGVDNGSTFLAKNSAGSYENFLWPRWSDNVMYLNYGAGGFNIRNNASVSAMFMTNSGFVGIGVTPITKLDVSGIKSTGAGSGTGGSNDAASQAIIPAGNNGASRNNDWPAGWGGGLSTWDIVGASTFFNSYLTRSDSRLKSDIKTIDKSIVSDFMKIRPVTYFMKEKTNETEGLQYGFIAQEIRDLFPSMVTQSTDPNGIIGMNYQALISPTIYVVQQQQVKIEELQKQVDSQNEKLSKMEEELKQIKQMLSK